MLGREIGSLFLGEKEVLVILEVRQCVPEGLFSVLMACTAFLNESKGLLSDRRAASFISE